MSDFSFDKDFQGEAILEYGDSDFIILKAGSFVRCAVTGDPIPLDQLRYWNVDEQEAYKDVLVAKQRWFELNTEPGK